MNNPHEQHIDAINLIQRLQNIYCMTMSLIPAKDAAEGWQTIDSPPSKNRESCVSLSTVCIICLISLIMKLKAYDMR